MLLFWYDVAHPSIQSLIYEVEGPLTQRGGDSGDSEGKEKLTEHIKNPQYGAYLVVCALPFPSKQTPFSQTQQDLQWCIIEALCSLKMSRMAHKETVAAVYTAFHLSRDFFVLSLQPEINWGQIFYLEQGGKKNRLHVVCLSSSQSY